MQRLIDLLGENKKIFVELSNENLKQKFLQQAEDEGFVINDKMPTTQNAESVMIVHNDYTITCLHGFAAHLHYHTCSKDMCINYCCILNNML
ncbi:MAG: hypothetical protein IJ643_10970 [Eubacterium sp.]|nr:hypothetical protein [Eubacterium sp.]